MPILFPGAGDSINVRLLSVGCIELGSWWANTDRLRGFWRLYVNLADGAGLKLAGDYLPMPRGRIVLVPPALDFEPRLERPLEQLFVHFECVGWPLDATRELLPSAVVLARDPQRDLLALGLCDDLATSCHGLEPVLAGRVKALVHLAISGAVEAPGRSRDLARLREAPRHRDLIAVFQYIDEHLGERISVATLAELACTSESQLIRGFREATGQTPARYVQDRRVKLSAELLVATSASIEEIAERCGFANRYYFSRVFARRMGCPPARYRSDRLFLEERAS